MKNEPKVNLSKESEAIDSVEIAKLKNRNISSL